VVQSVVRDGQRSCKTPATNRNDRPHQSCCLITGLLKSGLLSHLRRRAIAQATRGQKQQSKTTTRRGALRVGTRRNREWVRLAGTPLSWEGRMGQELIAVMSHPTSPAECLDIADCDSHTARGRANHLDTILLSAQSFPGSAGPGTNDPRVQVSVAWKCRKWGASR